MDLKELLSAVTPTREEIEQMTSPGDDVIFFLNSQNAEGKPIYVYLSVSARRSLDFIDAMKTGQPIKLQEFGNILKMGEGETPTPEVIKEMKEKYDADTPVEYLEKITPELTKRIKNHIDKKAEDSIMSKIEEMKKLQSGSGDKK